MLLVYIVLSVQPSKPIKEGMLDYFTVEQYLKTIPTTQGRYVEIRPSTSSGDGRLSISQIQVIDMNGNNIALNMPTLISGTATGSAKVSVTVDGTLEPRVGPANVWTSAPDPADATSEYWTVDLGDVYQISQVVYSGEASAYALGSRSSTQGYSSTLTMPQRRSQGMTCNILDVTKATTASMTFPYADLTQTITFPNSINITPMPSDTSANVKNPPIISLNTPQPEVFVVTGNYAKDELDITCGLLGATVATTGQVSSAKIAGARWAIPAWAIVSAATNKEYVLNNPTESGVNSSATNNTTRVAVNCFGIKPESGTASTVEPFNSNNWSQYTDKYRPVYYGTSTVSVPDVTKLYNFVQTTLTSTVMKNLNDEIDRLYSTLPQPETITTNAANVLGLSVGGNMVQGYKVNKKFDTSKKLSISELDAELNNVFNPNSCQQGGPRGTDPKCSATKPLDSLIYNYGSFNNATLYSALEAAPLNLTLDSATFTSSELAAIYSNIDIFGTFSSQARSDMETSMSLCSRIFLGSEPDVGYYINISYADLKPYIRATTGYTKFCKQEIVQSIEKGDYVFKVVSANQNSNRINCNTPFTSDMLGLLPSPARDYVQIWIYNRIIRFLQYKKSSNTLTQSDLNNLGLGDLTITADMALLRGSVMKMQPTINNKPIPIDVTNSYILDKIAQAFYEAMGGNYTMSQIYDVFTIGGTIMDIRFDMTKHADISAIHAQIASLRRKYYYIRSSYHISQDILDDAKISYETALADLQAAQATNTFPPITGVVGRFFYTYSTDTTKFTITGFTLDSRAVTSFIPELNCGVQVSTGSAAGALDYTPSVVFTRNIPEALPCRDETTLRKIMDDYINLTQTDLQSVLLGKLQSDGKTYVGPADSLSVDTTLGTVHVNQIIGAIQISPTQCAVSWTETLWNDVSNVPLKFALTNIRRNAIFSYAVNTTDWYANTMNIDPSGVRFYATPSVPACTFDPVAWQNVTTPRLDTAALPAIQADFIANGWNNGMGLACPNTIPNYIFSAQDYCAANPNANTRFNAGGSGPLDSAGALRDYSTSGIQAGRVLRAQQAITPLPKPIVIVQPLPPNNSLDDLDGVCPSTTCQDLNVLYTLADEYNNDPASPGNILRIKRAYTASPYQCDVEADINYNVTTENAAGKTVVKGSFNYNERGGEIPCKNCPPADRSREYTDVTLALSLGRNIDDCTFSFYGAEGRGSGTTIQTNTPFLYKTMEYTSFLTDVNLPSIATSFDAINSAVGDAANNTTSVLSSYRTNTVAAVGNIATLGTGCTAKCSDTAVMNNMIAFYKTQMNRTKQINTVLRMGTLNATTCDMTFQEDTLTPSGTGYRITSSQTAGMRFTLAPDTAGACTFTTTAMTSILPGAPPSVALDMNQIPSSAACKEVYGINSNSLTQQGAVEKCTSYGGVLATKKQLTDAAAAGASWSAPGYVVDVEESMFSPNGTILRTSEKGLGGAACYGVKPAYGQAEVLPFARTQWNQSGACAPSIPYVNPGKEAFMNYGQPVQITESTFPLNTKSFGLDMARNNGGPDIDTLYEEPLRAPDRPTGVHGPKDLGDDSLLQPGKGQSYKYLRFRTIKTRDPANPTVDVGKFRFLLGHSEVDLRFAKVTNPMGSWVGDLQDVVGSGYRRGFSDMYKKALVFAFPYAMLINGFTWTTANPDRGVGGDPVQWKLEGSQNGTYWVTLRNQTKHNYPVPVERYQELPVFRF